MEEMEGIMGRLGYRDAFDSCNDPDGSEIYGHWAAQEAYLDYREAVRLAEIIKVSIYNASPSQPVPGNDIPSDEIIKVSLALAGSYQGRAPTLAEARQQAETCKIDPLFANMIQSSNFKSISQYMIEQSAKTFWEYGTNYCGDGHFGQPFTKRTYGRIDLSEPDLYHLLFGRADVFIHTHPGPDVAPGLSGIGGDITVAKNFSIGIMAIDISDPNNPKYYCYNPEKSGSVI